MRQSKAVESATAEERPASRRVGQLRRLWPFIRPYRLPALGALVALTVAAVTVLGLGFGLRKLVDEGFAGGDAALLDRAMLVLMGVIVLLDWRAGRGRSALCRVRSRDFPVAGLFRSDAHR
jgi:ATP-binding cassette subfamily B protein